VVYDTSGWSGRYLGELAGSAGGCEVQMRFPEALEIGNAISVVPADRFQTGEFPSLQLIDGRLHEVGRDGKRRPVSGKAIGVA